MDRRTHWRGQPDTLKWRFYGLVGLSLVLHSALTPFAALLGLLGLLGVSDAPEVHDLPPITAIPIDIIEDEAATETGGNAEPEQEEGTTLSAPSTPELPPDAPSAPEAPARETPDAGAEATPEQEGDAGADHDDERPIGDPVALSGSAAKLTDSNANVRIKVDTDKVRRHPLGTQIGAVLGNVPQWHDFLGPAQLDPIRDIDRLLIVGPQLRDSSEVAAVLKYNVDQATMEAAIDNLVQRSQGEWLPGPPKAATAKADRAERIFAFIAPELVAIVPPSAKEATLKTKKGATLKAIPGDAVLTVHVGSPHKVYLGLPITFPEGISWIRVRVTPAADGGAVAEIEIEDASEEAAENHASWLERRLTALATPSALEAYFVRRMYGIDRYLDEVRFRADGRRIHGRLSVTLAQLTGALKFVEGIVASWRPKPNRPAPEASAVAPSSSPAPGSPRAVSPAVSGVPSVPNEPRPADPSEPERPREPVPAPAP